MSEEKYVEYKGGSLRRGRSPLMWFLDTLLALATLGLAMVLPMVYLVPYVAPARMWLFPVMALAVPALYVLAAVLACYWIVRWRLVRAGLLLLLLAVGLFKVPLFWKPQLGRVYAAGKVDAHFLQPFRQRLHLVQEGLLAPGINLYKLL